MTTGALFPQLPAAPAPVGPFVAVALEDSLDKLLDYAVPPGLAASILVGQRVRVPLGRSNRPAYGYVVAVKDVTEIPRIKTILAIDDPRALLSPHMLDLARWMSRYYCAPLGVVIESILPSAVKKRIGAAHVFMVRLAQERHAVEALLEKTKAHKRRAILARLLLVEPGGAIELHHLANEAGATAPTVRKLAQLGLVTIAPQIDWSQPIVPPSPSPLEGDLALNDDQKKVMADLAPRIAGGGFSVNLLQGVTGSGKTEIYLQCIHRLVDAGRQAIVLVPEIALTPQTVRRFTARFPRVAVLHSGLTPTDRHRFWRQIAAGDADVVVGARSAVFAPMPRLGLIVVDEEHDSSYKQDTAPRYQGRDVAIKRAQVENVPVILGSATPSLETYWRVTRPPPDPLYHRLILPKRVRGLAMPHVELIDMKQEARFRRGVHLLSQRLEHLLDVTVKAGHQAILLLNRRGYSNFVYCPSCQNVIQCKYCDTTMTYHRWAATSAHGASLAQSVHTGQLQCHYCLATSSLPEKCPQCGKKLSLFGLGTQRVEEELARKFPGLRYARVDSDTMRSGRDYEALLGRFATGEIQVMLGTQMIAKGLDYPNVTLVGVISGDTALALPDFRSAERTFQLITQVAGRAGRGDAPGRVALQTFLPTDPTILAALRQDFEGFAATELVSRRQVGLPPFVRMVRIVLRHQDSEKLTRLGEELAAALKERIAALPAAVTFKGPMPCAINRIAGYFRQQIVMTAARAEELQKLLASLRESSHLARSDRIAVDVDPVSLL